MKKQINQIKAGVFLSYVNLALGTLIPVFYTPIMLRMLGQSEHGLYALANSAVGYLSLLSFGFGSTIFRYFSKYRAENDVESIRRTYGFFLKLYLGLMLLVIAGGTALMHFAPMLFDRKLAESELDTLRYLIPVLSMHTAVTFPLSIFNSLIMSHERYLFRRIMDILGTILVPVSNLIALHLGYASIGLAVSGFLLELVMSIPCIFYCTRSLGYTPTFKPIPKALVRELVGFSSYVFLSSIADVFFWSTDKVILGMLLGSIAVSVYQVGSMFNGMVMQLSSSISNVLIPRITGMIVKNAFSEELSDLFIRVGRIQFLIVALIISGFVGFGMPFVQMWAGNGYRSAYWITVLTLIPLCVPLIQSTGDQILLAQNKHKFRSLVYLVIAIANVISTWLIVPYMGGIGAALCSCVSYLLGQGIVMNLYYHKVIQINIPRFWKEIGTMTAVPVGLMVLTLLIQKIYPVRDWFTFFAGVFLYSILYCIGMYRFSMNDYEKNLIRKPVSKILSKLSKITT